MNKIKSIGYATAAAVLTLPILVSAKWDMTETIKNSGGLSSNSFFEILARLLNYLLGIVGILAVVGFVVSGIMYITAAGDEDRVEKAKQMLTYSIIGLVVALLGLVIVTALDFIINQSTIPDPEE